MKSTTRSKSTVRLSLDSLESRLTPAGNVTAIYDPVTLTLTITGDALNNTVNVSIDSTNAPMVTTVWGSDLETTINGLPSVVIWDWCSKIVVDGGDGSDRLFVDNQSLWSGDMILQGGDGDDTIAITQGSPLGNLSIDAGRGNDLIDLAGDVLGSLVITAGEGKDRLYIHSIAVNGNVQVDMGKGNDSILIDAGFIGLGTTNLDGGQGRDEITLPTDLLKLVNLERFEVIIPI